MLTGKEVLPIPENYLSSSNFSTEEDEDEPFTNGKAGQPGMQMPDPSVLFTALMAAAQSMNIKSAMKQTMPDGKNE